MRGVTRVRLALLGLIVPLLGAGVERPNVASDTDRGASEPPVKRCIDCHRFPAHLSHPVGIPPRGSTDLPLESGLIGCTTCHDDRLVHQQSTTSRFPDAGLRQPVRQLCNSCHSQPTDLSGRLAHALASGRAHPVSDDEPLAADGLDRASRACLACHDGSVASEARTERNRTADFLQRSHPVGRRYRDPRNRKAYRGLRPRRALPAGMSIPGGTVGCSSCHSVYSKEPDMLTVTNHHSRLCLTCHLK